MVMLVQKTPVLIPWYFLRTQKKAIVTHTITEVITGHTDRCFWREAKLNNNTPS